MIVIIKKASDWDYLKYEEINTLEELLKIYSSLIIQTDKNLIKLYNRDNKKVSAIINIYDDYVE